MPATASSELDHPTWCDPRACTGSRDRLRGVRHSGTPVMHRALADDVEITLALHRDDSLTPPAVGITLDVRHTESDSPSGGPVHAEVLLLPAEAELLAHRLLELTAQTRLNPHD